MNVMKYVEVKIVEERMDSANGLYIVWENHGYEGWMPYSYPDLKSALAAKRYSSEYVVTLRVSKDPK